MSSIRALRLQSALRPSALRPSALRPAPRIARRTYAAKEPAREKAPTGPDELSNKGTLYLIAGVAVTVGAFFAFLMGSPDRAAGVIENGTRGKGGGSAFVGYGSKPSSERHLEETTGRDPLRQSGLAGLKSEQIDPNQPSTRN
ncbi:hypothetical protein CTA2_6997 [Colletotrichum tanaceti]|uniref:Uncharacterized protein n=1 Tax=Colletotrichum tanaceti TaxID=1306861 RepID=A0A4U6XDM2_9PEZI|nr:hypothetical protein CTA2_6997 [Colletotrichum tanaceti]TKW53871.1 hypothetical protein CTA1_9642 [Colletotrichum tanaceti]